MVAKGYNRKKGLDYTENLSPVAKMVTMKSIIALAAFRHWLIYQMDVHNVFLNGDLLKEVYMHIFEGFCRQGETQKVCKLQKSLYGPQIGPTTVEHEVN